ncbi:hypothetical protein [Flavihumibacter solisilvae]|uniref:Uncharacterized protein n=1 Tax=Flavihumibacter solisilvae TaxID=1349421 RepID=A0A0C1IEN4_9BACT|nr:hypothetical protein [Flavihumibacter solisilvae]KIC92620.1 hypothetical protein OI18_21805 [Flavihumibacter solisilvae]
MNQLNQEASAVFSALRAMGFHQNFKMEGDYILSVTVKVHVSEFVILEVRPLQCGLRQVTRLNIYLVESYSGIRGLLITSVKHRMENLTESMLEKLWVG